MPKIFLFSFFVSFLYAAAYNPFFNVKPMKKQEEPIGEIKTVQKQTQQLVKPQMKKKSDFKISYFGYLKTKKGSFALVEYENKTFVIKESDNIFLSSSKFKVVKIKTNAITLKRENSTYQNIYFSKRDNK